MPAFNNTDSSEFVLTSKNEANAIVKEYISHIEELSSSMKKNFDDMEMENTDVQVEISDIVADITSRLEKLVDSVQDVKF